MEIMKICKTKLEFWGILSNKWWRLMLWIPLSLMEMYRIYGEFWFFVLKTPKIFQASIIIYTSTSCVGCWFQLTELVLQRKRIRMFLKHFDTTINAFLPHPHDSSSSPSSDSSTDRATMLFRKTEQSLSKYCRLYEISLWCSVVCFSTLPAVLWMYHYFNGTLDHERLEAPFRDMYGFFDATQFPLREITYALNVIAFMFVAPAYLVVDLTYLGICLYLVAMFKYLKIQLSDLDQLRPERKYAGVSKCLRIHQAIIMLIDEFNELFSNIVFIQFAYSLISLLTCVLSALYSDNSYLVPIACNYCTMMSGLYLYMLMGNIVVNAGNSVRDAVYSVSWYDYPVDAQLVLLMIILRTNREVKLGAYNFFICSHETFKKIMSNIYSMLAFLRNMID